jgi:hypothetical protein
MLLNRICNYIWNYVQIYRIILLFNTSEIKYTLFPKLIYPKILKIEKETLSISIQQHTTLRFNKDYF